MALDLRVIGDPAAIRDTATWLGNTSQNTYTAATSAHQARTGTEAGWQGQGGDGFRSVLTRFGSGIDTLATDLDGTRGAISTHADDLDTVRARMRQAREGAAAAGLSVSEFEIAEPGPAPVAPAGLPLDRPATADEVAAFDRGQQAVAVHAAQVAAYRDAAWVVTEARGIETQSQSVLNRYLQNMAGRAPLAITDIAVNLPGVSIDRTSKFRAKAQVYADRAASRAALARNSGPIGWVGNTLAKHYNLHREATKLDRAAPTAWSRRLDQLPDRVKTELTRKLAPGLPVLKKVPVLGVVVTGAGIWLDVANGRNPAHATASGVSALVSGAVVGAAIGGPVGLVVGAVVGAGVGFVVDEWGDDVARGVGDTAVNAWEAGGDVVDNIGTGFSRIREALDPK